MGNINLFELAETQILREGKEPNEPEILAYAVKIRRWLDIHKTAGNRILAGEQFKQKGNRILFK